MMNVVLMFSPIDEKTPYEQRENRMEVIRFLAVGSSAIDNSKIS